MLYVLPGRPSPAPLPSPPHSQVPRLSFKASASALDRTLRRARGAHAALPLQEREPGGEDGEGRGGRAGVPVCAVSQRHMSCCIPCVYCCARLCCALADPLPCSYSVFTVISITIPARITGSKQPRRLAALRLLTRCCRRRPRRDPHRGCHRQRERGRGAAAGAVALKAGRAAAVNRAVKIAQGRCFS